MTSAPVNSPSASVATIPTNTTETEDPSWKYSTPTKRSAHDMLFPSSSSSSHANHHFHHTSSNKKQRPASANTKGVATPTSPFKTPSNKKVKRGLVTRTHSPKSGPSPVSSPVRGVKSCDTFQLHKIMPTVRGLQEIARHVTDPETTSRHPLVAIPTECSYEICASIPWNANRKNKGTTSTATNTRSSDDATGDTSDESDDTDDVNSPEQLAVLDERRERRIDQLRLWNSTSSATPMHIYIDRENVVSQLDKLFQFPKKVYMLRQNQKLAAKFHEVSVVCQCLSEQYWPGPVTLYIKPSPDCISLDKENYIGIRCPSHPLAVSVLKQIKEESNQSQQQQQQQPVLIGAPIQRCDVPKCLFKAKDVTSYIAARSTTSLAVRKNNDSSIQVLQGEERKEIFSVPTCQFQDHWLECWIIEESRTIVLKGKSQRKLSNLQFLLQSAPLAKKSRVIRSVISRWKIDDQRSK